MNQDSSPGSEGEAQSEASGYEFKDGLDGITFVAMTDMVLGRL